MLNRNKILALILTVFSLFTVPGVLYPFSEFRLKYGLEIVQKPLDGRGRICNFSKAYSKSFLRPNLYKLYLLLKQASNILCLHVKLFIEFLTATYNAIKSLFIHLNSVKFNYTSDRDYLLLLPQF